MEEELIHPFRRIRLANHLTQADIARMADVTPQTVLRTEQGLYGTPSTKIVRVLSELPVAEDNLAEQYRAWQSAHRIANKYKIAGLILAWKNTDGRPIVMPQLRRVLGQSSLLGMCKLICVHPSQVNRYTNQGGSLFFLEEALRDVLSEEDVKWVSKNLRPL